MDEVATHIPSIRGLKTAFISTAPEGEPGDKTWLNDDRKSLVKVGLDVFDYTLTGKSVDQVKNDLSDSDVLFFCGGNTFYLCEKIQQSSSAGIIREFIEGGKSTLVQALGRSLRAPMFGSLIASIF